jgi:hypothetical protein
LRTKILLFVAIIQSILFLAHGFVYETWTIFRAVPDPRGITRQQAVVALLSISFVAATLLSFRYSSWPVRLFYSIAAVWLGFFNFFFIAACMCWVAFAGARLLSLRPEQPLIAGAMFGLALMAGLYGILNARWIRVRRITVKLPHLPQSWRGRVAALVTDVHLGSINGTGFIKRIVATLRPLRPDIVFIAGDLYDGTKVEPYAAVAP